MDPVAMTDAQARAVAEQFWLTHQHFDQDHLIECRVDDLAKLIRAQRAAVWREAAKAVKDIKSKASFPYSHKTQTGYDYACNDCIEKLEAKAAQEEA